MLTIDLINTFLSLWLKPMIMLAFILSVVRRSYIFSASSSHWFLACALISVFIALPALLYLPSISLSILPNAVVPLTQFSIGGEDISSSYVYWGVGLYLLGVMWVLFFQLASIIDIHDLTKQAQDVRDDTVDCSLTELTNYFNIDKKVSIKVSTELDSPVVWGHYKPCIILPKHYRSWDQGRLLRVLAHELAHIARNDWIIKMCVKLCCAVMWIVPLAWYVAKRLEWYAELSCDDTVINALDCRSEYAEDLLALSFSQNRPAIALALIQSEMFLRIQHVLDGRNQRVAVPLINKYIHGLLCILLIFPVSIIHAVPSAEQESLYDDFNDIHFEYKKEKKQVQQEETIYEQVSIGYIPVKHPAPESPDFAEEVYVHAGEIISNVDPNALLENQKGLLAKADIGGIKIPYTEVKGFLPRVMASPRYPSRALSKGIEGQVIIQFDIDEQGSVFNPRIVVSQPKRVFDRAVLKALKKFKFTPMEIEGQAVTTRNVTETFIFKIDEQE